MVPHPTSITACTRLLEKREQLRGKERAICKEYYTSFAGYFPAEAPRYSCIVVIDDPKGYQIYGSDVSAPVFKEIADKIYS